MNPRRGISHHGAPLSYLIVCCIGNLNSSTGAFHLMSHRYLRALSAVLVSLALSLSAAAADKSKTKSGAANQPSYELPQPQHETLDLAVYQQIRDEGLGHSHVMEYASGLDDGIGPRLRFAEPTARQRLDARSVHRDGMQQRPPRGLGRVRR